jgi:hypothetical protein
MAEFFEGGSLRDGFFAVVEEAGELGFASAGDDFAQYFGRDIDSAVQRRWWVVGLGWAVWMGVAAEVVESGKAGAGFGFAEVGSVAWGSTLGP